MATAAPAQPASATAEAAAAAPPPPPPPTAPQVGWNAVTAMPSAADGPEGPDHRRSAPAPASDGAASVMHSAMAVGS